MSILNRSLGRSSEIFRQLVRLSSTSTHLFDFEMPSKFSPQDKEKILKTLNESNTEELSSFSVSKAKIKSLDMYRRKHGPFQSLNDVLEVDGLSVKILEKICDEIITDTPSTALKKANNNPAKRVRQFLAPLLPSNLTVTSVVGLHVAPMGISWSKLTLDNDQITVWGYQDFASLPKKMLPTETFTLAINILKDIPVGDVYVFEGASSMGLQGQKQAQISPYTQQCELTSMLLALINTSPLHNAKLSNSDEQEYENRVFFLRSKLYARLFNTLVGNECVSSTQIVSQFLANESHFNLPCSQFAVDQNLKVEYTSQLPVHKELLGQALMLTVAFTDLCWRKNPVSLAAVAPRRR